MFSPSSSSSTSRNKPMEQQGKLTSAPAASHGHSKRAKYKKAPGAPKRFKSAFIFFSTEKHKEIRAEMGEKGSAEKTTNVAKLVSEAWRNLKPEEREKWEDLAKQDRQRYEEERRTYRGPWKIAVSRKPYKDPNAPKRPMSAFLMYSNGRRAAVKKEHPEFSNGEISRLLSEMWRAASEEERQKYIKEEYKLRQEYKVAMAAFRKESEEKEKLRLQEQEEEEANAPPHRDDMSRLSSLFAGASSGQPSAASFLGGAGAAGSSSAYLAAAMASGQSPYDELVAMQRARQLEAAEQRARMLQSALGGAGAAGLDAGDPYSRLAAGYPATSAAAAAYGGYSDMLGGTVDGMHANPFARQGGLTSSAAALRQQQQDLQQQQELLALQEQEHAAALSLYGQQPSYFGQTESQAAAAAALDAAYGRYGGAASEASLAEAAYAQQQLGYGGVGAAAAYGGAAGYDPRGRGAGGAFGRSP